MRLLIFTNLPASSVLSSLPEPKAASDFALVASEQGRRDHWKCRRPPQALQMVRLASMVLFLLIGPLVAQSAQGQEEELGPNLWEILANPEEHLRDPLSNLVDPATRNVLPEDLAEMQEARQELHRRSEHLPSHVYGQCAEAADYFNNWIQLASNNALGINGSVFGGPGGPAKPALAADAKQEFFDQLEDCDVVAAAQPSPVYFKSNEYTLSDAAIANIDHAVAAAPGATFNVTGHTDTSGSAADNLALGQRRANTVSSALLARGASVSSALSRGENDPAIDAGDGVSEPLNQRAVMEIASDSASPIAHATFSDSFDRDVCIGETAADSQKTFQLVGDRLGNAIRVSRHGRPSYFSTTNYMTILSSMKPIQSNGILLSAGSRSTNSGTWRDWIPKRDPVLHRLFLFVLSDQSLSNAYSVATSEQLTQMRNGGSSSARPLDRSSPSPEFTAEHDCYVYIYIYRSLNDDPAAKKEFLSEEYAVQELSEGLDDVTAHADMAGIIKPLVEDQQND